MPPRPCAQRVCPPRLAAWQGGGGWGKAFSSPKAFSQGPEPSLEGASWRRKKRGLGKLRPACSWRRGFQDRSGPFPQELAEGLAGDKGSGDPGDGAGKVRPSWGRKSSSDQDSKSNF